MSEIEKEVTAVFCAVASFLIFIGAWIVWHLRVSFDPFRNLEGNLWSGAGWIFFAVFLLSVNSENPFRPDVYGLIEGLRSYRLRTKGQYRPAVQLPGGVIPVRDLD